jgi:hypothetical protein
MASDAGETVGLLSDDGGAAAPPLNSNGGRRRSTSSQMAFSDDVPRVPRALPFYPDGSASFVWGLGLALCTCGVSMVPWIVRETLWKQEHDDLNPYLDGEGFLAPSRSDAPPVVSVVPPHALEIDGGDYSSDEGGFERNFERRRQQRRRRTSQFDPGALRSDVPEPLDMHRDLRSPVEIL